MCHSWARFGNEIVNVERQPLEWRRFRRTISLASAPSAGILVESPLAAICGADPRCSLARATLELEKSRVGPTPLLCESSRQAAKITCQAQKSRGTDCTGTAKIPGAHAYRPNRRLHLQCRSIYRLLVPAFDSTPTFRRLPICPNSRSRTTVRLHRHQTARLAGACSASMTTPRRPQRDRPHHQPPASRLLARPQLRT